MVLVTKDKYGRRSYIEVVQLMEDSNGLDAFGETQDGTPFRQNIKYIEYDYVGVVVEGRHDVLHDKRN